jgi:hypothetical protein
MAKKNMTTLLEPPVALSPTSPTDCKQTEFDAGLKKIHLTQNTDTYIGYICCSVIQL